VKKFLYTHLDVVFAICFSVCFNGLVVRIDTCFALHLFENGIGKKMVSDLGISMGQNVVNWNVERISKIRRRESRCISSEIVGFT